MIIEAIVEKGALEVHHRDPGYPWSPSRCVTTDYSVTDLVSLALTFKTKGSTIATPPPQPHAEPGRHQLRGHQYASGRT